MTKPLTAYEQDLLVVTGLWDDSEPDWVKRARLYVQTPYHRWAAAEIRAWERAWALGEKRTTTPSANDQDGT